MAKNLILHVTFEYFIQIDSGEKKEEYRIVTPYWWSRLYGKIFDKIIILHGYPKREDYNPTNYIEFPWNGYKIKVITHPLFGNVPQEVFAIKLEKNHDR